ncbi:MAG: hypothetical protein WA324_04925 [Bryobacteraceae bacterium]
MSTVWPVAVTVVGVGIVGVVGAGALTFTDPIIGISIQCAAVAD